MTRVPTPQFRLTDDGLLHFGTNAAPDYERLSPDAFVRRAAQRGHTDLGWLHSYHSFSFGDYFDRNHMGFRSLRVINDDKIAPRGGFPTHPHRDMEIITYLLEGELQHRDSTGRGAIVTPEYVQMMSAGRGIFHSEYNPSAELGNHLLQIWIKPAIRGVEPRYGDAKLTAEEKTNRWKLIAGPDDSGATVGIYADARVYAAAVQAGQAVDYTLEDGRHLWLQVARGDVIVNGTPLGAGDAIASSVPAQLHVVGRTEADILLFDLG